MSIKFFRIDYINPRGIPQVAIVVESCLSGYKSRLDREGSKLVEVKAIEPGEVFSQ